MKKKSKRFKKLIDLKKKEQVKTLENKIDLIKKMSNTKFVESVDLSFKINLKKLKGADTNLRTIIELPNGSGKKFKVAVLCDENKLTDAKTNKHTLHTNKLSHTHKPNTQTSTPTTSPIRTHTRQLTRTHN